MEDSDDERDASNERLYRIRDAYKYLRMVSLLMLWIFFTVSLIINPEHIEEKKTISLSSDQPFDMNLSGNMLPHQSLYGIEIYGPIIGETNIAKKKANGSIEIKFESKSNRAYFKPTANAWKVPLALSDPEFETAKRAFELPKNADEFHFSITVEGADGQHFPLKVTFLPKMVPSHLSVILAALLLLSLYILIIWEIVDRVFAALLIATTSIAMLGWLNIRPSLEVIVSWIDISTLLLLFGMMILVAILSDTGVFDCVAVFAYKISRGNAWPLIYSICLFTGLLSAFLDNVTMMLLMTPVTIRLCEVMNLHVTNVLIVVVVFSNIGGTMTPVGDPPNVIIASNTFIQSQGIDFMTFTSHMTPVILFCMILTLIQVRFQLGNKGITPPPEEESMKIARQVEAWRHAQRAVGNITQREQEANEELNAKIKALKDKYKAESDKKQFGLRPAPNYIDTLSEMEARYPIRNKPLLYKAMVALAFTISCFFLHSLPAFEGLSLEWTAVLGALLLLILSATEDISDVLERVEWSTLLFFAALFILMESLGEMGLIEWIGLQTVKLISYVNEEGRLSVAILIMLWISGTTSAFVDNIPVTTMMIKLCIHIYSNDSLSLPLTPLVWSLALGACLGGNGTLIGASANVVCAGIAAQHGYKFSFYDFFKIAFPITIQTLITSSVYLLLCHVVGKWQ